MNRSPAGKGHFSERRIVWRTTAVESSKAVTVTLCRWQKLRAWRVSSLDNLSRVVKVFAALDSTSEPPEKGFKVEKAFARR